MSTGLQGHGRLSSSACVERWLARGLLSAALCLGPWGFALAASQSSSAPAPASPSASASVPVSTSPCAVPVPVPSSSKNQALDVQGWLERIRQATDFSTYSGTFMVSASSGVMSSSRVWHVCADGHQIERIEALTGSPRVVYRQNADVRTFMVDDRVVRIDSRDMPRKFARTKGIDAESLAAHYEVEASGHDQRVAGMESDVLQLRARDAWRFSYRIWLDRKSGLMLKWQTLAPNGRVLEQAAFSDLEMSAPVGVAQMQAMMNDVIGYRVVSEPRLPTTLAVNGWLLPIPVDGFVLLSCEQKQKIHPQPARTAMVQCVYSDGLASISVFLEPFSEERHRYEGQELRLGATHTLSGRVAGDSWVTMIGEVPLATLRRFASAIKQAPH